MLSNDDEDERVVVDGLSLSRLSRIDFVLAVSPIPWKKKEWKKLVNRASILVIDFEMPMLPLEQMNFVWREPHRKIAKVSGNARYVECGFF